MDRMGENIAYYVFDKDHIRSSRNSTTTKQTIQLRNGQRTRIGIFSKDEIHGQQTHEKKCSG